MNKSIFINFQKLLLSDFRQKKENNISYIEKENNTYVFKTNNLIGLNYCQSGFYSTKPLLNSNSFTVGLSFICLTDDIIKIYSQGSFNISGSIHIYLNCTYCKNKNKIIKKTGNLLFFWSNEGLEGRQEHIIINIKISKNIPFSMVFFGRIKGAVDLYVDNCFFHRFIAPMSFLLERSFLFYNFAKTKKSIILGSFFYKNEAISFCNVNLLFNKILRNISKYPVRSLLVQANSYSICSISNKIFNFEEEYDSFKKITPASINKLMVIYLILYHKIDVHILVEVLQEDICRGSGNNLKAGDILKISDHVFNMLLASSNTSSNVVARYLGSKVIINNLSGISNVDKFVYLMNITAKKIGMHSTYYTNPHGLFSNKKQYTTTRDTCLLVGDLLNIDCFKFFFKKNAVTVNIKGKNKRSICIKSTLPDFCYNEPGFLLGKTGTLIGGKGGDIINFLGVFESAKGSYYIYSIFGFESSLSRRLEVARVLHYFRYKDFKR